MPRRPAFVLRLPRAIERLSEPGGKDLFTADEIGMLLSCSGRTARRMLRKMKGAKRVGHTWVAGREDLRRHLEGLLSPNQGFVEALVEAAGQPEVIEAPAPELLEHVRFEEGRVVIEAAGTKELLRTMAGIVAQVKLPERRRVIEARLQGRRLG